MAGTGQFGIALKRCYYRDLGCPQEAAGSQKLPIDGRLSDAKNLVKVDQYLVGFAENNDFDHGIFRFRVPVLKGRLSPDAAAFLSYFLPKGTHITAPLARKTASMLHLAFKGMESDEIYNVLMEQFLEAVAKYDPDYTEKVRLVAECIDEKLSGSKQIRSVELERKLDFECDRYLRLLARRGFLQAVKDKTGRICGWERSGLWPPPAEFFQSGAIGLAYFVQTWFRYYLQRPRMSFE